MLRSVFLSYVFAKVLEKENMIRLSLFENIWEDNGWALFTITPFLILYLGCDRDNNGGYLHSQSQRAGKMAPQVQTLASPKPYGRRELTPTSCVLCSPQLRD